MANKLSHYQGAYTVEFYPEANIKRLTHFPGVSLLGKTASVYAGRVIQVIGGIQFYAYEIPFTWSYNYIKRIEDSDGKILWQNWKEES